MSKKGQPKFCCEGMNGTQFHSAWKAMKTRCRKPDTNDSNRKCYNGVTFTDHWLDFLNFKEDMYTSYLEHLEEHGRSNTSLDRIDGSKGYSKENCRWATKQQQTNNRKNVKLYTFQDETMNLKQWADKLGMCRSVLAMRVKNGWLLEDVLSTKRHRGKTYERNKI